jgi:hypothetical protein
MGDSMLKRILSNFVIGAILLCLQCSYATTEIFRVTAPIDQRLFQLVDPLGAQKRIMVLKLIFNDSQKSFSHIENKYRMQLRSTKWASPIAVAIMGLFAAQTVTNKDSSGDEILGVVGVTTLLATAFYYLGKKNLSSLNDTFQEDENSYKEFLKLLRMEVESELIRYNLQEARDLLQEIDKAQLALGELRG